MEISFQKAGIGSPLFHDYITGKLDPGYYTFSPDLQGLDAAIAQRSFPGAQRALLVDALKKQYGRLERSAAVDENINRLADAHTFTVTTGHQLCIYTGPLYFIYKIVSVISLCRDLNARHADKHFVPVYWMNSEDHDFAEISYFHFLGRRFEWSPGAALGGPVGPMHPGSLAEVDQQIREAFTNMDAYTAVLDMFRDAYAASATLAEATRRIANTLFGEYGLVVLDQDDAALKRSFAPIIRKEIENRESHTLVSETLAAWEKAGYEAQVNPREINFFYTGTGRRERIVWEAESYRVLNTELRFTPASLWEELEQHPQYFSPNVVTRPMYQEFILPNIAYIGGPAEVHYWLQYKAMFTYYGIHFPVLLMRDSFLLWPQRWQAKAEKLGLGPEDFFQPEEQIINQYMQRLGADTLSLDAQEEALRSIYAQVLTRALELDKTLEGAVKGEEQKAVNAMKGLEAKMLRALKAKNDQVVKSIRDAREKIFPEGSLQERYENILSFTATPDTLIRQLLARANPLDMQLKVITPEA